VKFVIGCGAPAVHGVAETTGVVVVVGSGQELVNPPQVLLPQETVTSVAVAAAASTPTTRTSTRPTSTLRSFAPILTLSTFAGAATRHDKSLSNDSLQSCGRKDAASYARGARRVKPRHAPCVRTKNTECVWGKGGTARGRGSRAVLRVRVLRRAASLARDSRPGQGAACRLRSQSSAKISNPRASGGGDPRAVAVLATTANTGVGSPGTGPLNGAISGKSSRVWAPRTISRHWTRA